MTAGLLPRPPRDDHRRAGLHRQQPRHPPGRARRRRAAGRFADSRLGRQPVQHRAGEGPGAAQRRRRAPGEHDELSGARPGRDLQPGRAGQSHRQHARPAHRPRDQLPGPAHAARGLPPPQPGREGGLRRHAPGLRPARLAAGHRRASGAPHRRQRHQQGGGRVLPPGLQQRLRRARLLTAAHQRLRPAPAHSPQPSGLHRLVREAGARPARDPGVRRRLPGARLRARRRRVRGVPAGRRERRGERRGLQRGRRRTLDARRSRGAAGVAGRRRVVPLRRVAGGEEDHRHRQLLRRLHQVHAAPRAGRPP